MAIARWSHFAGYRSTGEVFTHFARLAETGKEPLYAIGSPMSRIYNRMLANAKRPPSWVP